jgi:hypothetical protein
MCDVQVPPRKQLEADSSAGSEGGDIGNKLEGVGASAPASWLPPVKKEKQKRKVVGLGWFDGSGVGAAAAADAGGVQAGASQSEADDFGWENAQSTFQKRKPRAMGALGSRTAAAAVTPSIPKVNTHFMAGTGVNVKCDAFE